MRECTVAVCNRVCEAGALRIPSTAGSSIRSVYFAASARVNYFTTPTYRCMQWSALEFVKTARIVE